MDLWKDEMGLLNKLILILTKYPTKKTTCPEDSVVNYVKNQFYFKKKLS